MERTLALIKPDAVEDQFTGAIIACIEDAGFDIIGLKKLQLTVGQAEDFYAVHKDRSFFNELVEFMTSGPIIAMVLEKENAVDDWREFMGATDPEKAEEGTIRREFGRSIGENATHGSDSIENATNEIAFFFPELK
jgi:nucleoside-diphosphate kinase